jgi:hypothetical protein
METILSQRFETAKAIVLPPAPAKRSISMVLSDETCFERSIAICLVTLLAQLDAESGRGGELAYNATGSGVTPNHASSVI